MAAEGPNQVPVAGLPVITFSETTTFHYNSHVIHAFHPVPAHTDGDSVIHFRDIDVIHAGDVFWNGLYPFIDTSSGGSVAGTVTTLRKIADMAGPDTYIIPGHGPLGNQAAVTAAADMIEDCLDRVSALVADGKSLDEIKATGPFTDYDGTWGAGFINPGQWVETMYHAVVAQ
jgi:glyoxylase-like metal-dependent hydrolase (beta-lactamase superfamily II)